MREAEHVVNRFAAHIRPRHRAREHSLSPQKLRHVHDCVPLALPSLRGPVVGSDHSIRVTEVNLPLCDAMVIRRHGRSAHVQRAEVCAHHLGVSAAVVRRKDIKPRRGRMREAEHVVNRFAAHIRPRHRARQQGCVVLGDTTAMLQLFFIFHLDELADDYGRCHAGVESRGLCNVFQGAPRGVFL